MNLHRGTAPRRLVALWITLALGVSALVARAQTQPLAINETSLPNGNVGTEYTAFLSASGGEGQYRWRIVDGKAPSGLKLASSFASQSTLLNGIPTRDGTYTFTVQVKDDAGATATQSYTITIEAPQPLVITNGSPTLTSGTVGQPYATNLFANGGVQPYRWEISAGQLPPGLSLKENQISGTPTTGGTFVFTATVTDKAGAQASQEFTITVT